tara:strand:+ start:2385 stop:2576 length:192 start_codon:yes stop_codon:yes gene_type:complete
VLIGSVFSSDIRENILYLYKSLSGGGFIGALIGLYIIFLLWDLSKDTYRIYKKGFSKFFSDYF